MQPGLDGPLGYSQRLGDLRNRELSYRGEEQHLTVPRSHPSERRRQTRIQAVQVALGRGRIHGIDTGRCKVLQMTRLTAIPVAHQVGGDSQQPRPRGLRVRSEATRLPVGREEHVVRDLVRIAHAEASGDVPVHHVYMAPEKALEALGLVNALQEFPVGFHHPVLVAATPDRFTPADAPSVLSRRRSDRSAFLPDDTRRLRRRHGTPLVSRLVTPHLPVLRRRVATIAAALVCLGVSSSAVGAPAATAGTTAPKNDIRAYPIVKVPVSAAPAPMRREIERVNAWWARNRTFVPCPGCMVRPPASSILWTYYRGQGLYPNWVRAARDILRMRIRGNTPALRRGTAEIMAATKVQRAPDGTRFRTIGSGYTAPDGELPPWNDAMGAGLVLTLIIPALPDDPTRTQSNRAQAQAREMLNAFGVHYRNGGLTVPGKGRGLWYLEYAYANGDRQRVLNGFMQAVVSLHRFQGQADTLGKTDPSWYPLRDLAQDLVKRGTIEIVRNLWRYDNGDGWSRYSLTRPGRAPQVYHTYHLQLLARLEVVPYLPANHRRVLTDYRTRWGGKALTAAERRTDAVPPEAVRP